MDKVRSSISQEEFFKELLTVTTPNSFFVAEILGGNKIVINEAKLNLLDHKMMGELISASGLKMEVDKTIIVEFIRYVIMESHTTQKFYHMNKGKRKVELSLKDRIRMIDYDIRGEKNRSEYLQAAIAGIKLPIVKDMTKGRVSEQVN